MNIHPIYIYIKYLVNDLNILLNNLFTIARYVDSLTIYNDIYLAF